MAKSEAGNSASQELASNLENWASRYGLMDDPYIAGLLESLETNSNLHIWATLEPTDYLPFPSVRGGARLSARTRLLIVIRNVLVFAPVALTWIAVGQATQAFGAYVKENTASVVNFLDFWQNGYDILPPEYRIGSIARLDALIILAVIALTLVAAVTGQKAKVQHQSEQAYADRERMRLAVQISVFLHDKQQINAATVNQAVVAAIGKLLSTAENLEQTSRHMGKSIDSGLKTITKSVASTTKEVGKTLTASTKAAEKTMVTTAKSLGKFLDSSAKAAAKAAKKPVDQFIAEHEEYAEPAPAISPLKRIEPAEPFDFDAFLKSTEEAFRETPEEVKPSVQKKRWDFRGRS